MHDPGRVQLLDPFQRCCQERAQLRVVGWTGAKVRPHVAAVEEVAEQVRVLLPVAGGRQLAVAADTHDTRRLDALQRCHLALKALRLAGLHDDLAGHHVAAADHSPALAAAAGRADAVGLVARAERCFDVRSGDSHDAAAR